jgi:hypothetical protein
MAETMTVDMVRGGLGPLIERAGRSQGLTPGEARELLANSAIPVFLLENLWDQAKGMIERGVERRTLTAVLKELLDLLGSTRAAFDDVLSRAEELNLAPADVPALRGAAHNLDEMRESVAALHHRLAAPAAPVDPASLPPCSSEREAAGYASLDDLAVLLRPRGSV